METIVVKTEVQNNGEILLYYVDENGESQEGVLASVENIENDSMPMQSSYMLENYDELVDDPPELEQLDENDPNFWSDADTKRLLTFYNDNKITFVSGRTQKKHLWAVACKTMLIGKDQTSCEQKLNELKTKYFEVRGYIDKGVIVKWPFLDLCHSAFHDEIPIETTMVTPKVEVVQPEMTVTSQPSMRILSNERLIKDKNGILAKKSIAWKSPDEHTKQLLNAYLKYKPSFQKDYWRRDLWDKIAEDIGEEDSEYLQKKFLNHKQHYINLCLKRKENDLETITWPYMSIFDEIYKDDVQFHKKYFNEDISVTVTEDVKMIEEKVPEHEWDMVQMMILSKYYFDCHHEFEDDTIPKKFLWTEVSRLVEKKPESCEVKFLMLRKAHLEKIVAGDYNLQRIPLDILFDNIIYKDIQIILRKMETDNLESEEWSEELLDELVQFLYTNIEIFKDNICHFVCWAAIAHKLNKDIQSCKNQWDMLVELYKQILEEKKEDPDLQIDWRYIELFDRIFDYGMDESLLNGYELSKVIKSTNQVLVKKVELKPEDVETTNNLLVERSPSKTESSSYAKSMEPRTDPRSAKILEHYLKNKDKFQHARNKIMLWEVLAKQIGMSASECSHRFKTLKQTYVDYIQKEIDQPRVPITWPYYNLCKKVFGYRIIKNKLKQGELESDKDTDDWLAREIKALISFFSKKFHEINNNVEDVSIWAPLAKELGKTETNCKEKFVELRKCYRKLKTMRSRNPDVKISWSYFQMFERVYSVKDEEAMEVENLEEEHLEMDGEVGETEDYQCIIVLQDGQVILQNPDDINNPEIMQQLQMSNLSEITENTENAVIKTEHIASKSKWTKRSKKRLLIFYMNYIRSNRGKEISQKHLWTTVASKFQSKSPNECKKMFLKMKRAYEQANDFVKSKSPYAVLLDNVLKLKPKFSIKNGKESKKYKNVEMSSEKVNLALVYYLEHIDEFVNPQFEKKFLWTQLANFISEPVTKVYNKINYLKQGFNIETEEMNGEKTEFSGLLKEIIAKEVAFKMVLDIQPKREYDIIETWSDDEIETLLTWYLGNLEKFKNPKFNRSYLWMDVSNLLNKRPVTCSKKMSEVRSQYRDMVKQNAANLDEWRFFDLCQKIYGTGRKDEWR